MSILDVLKVFLRLGPKQVRDELRIAQHQMKTKGIEVGIGAGLAITGLLFLVLMVIAIVVLIVILFANIMPAWAAALVTAGIFLVIAGLLALFGVGKIKAAMPLVPEDALKGLRYDVQILKEGTEFNARDFDRQRRRAAKEAEQEKRRDAQQKQAAAPKVPAPSYHELIQRTTQRRDHLARLRDDALSKVGVDPHTLNEPGGMSVNKLLGRENPEGSPESETAETHFRHTGAPQSQAEEMAEKAKEVLTERWREIAVAGASSAAVAVLLRKIFKK